MLKPKVLCVLEKGKLIDVQDGFVDTFNWMCSWISKFKAGSSPCADFEVDTRMSDEPKLRITKLYYS